MMPGVNISSFLSIHNRLFWISVGIVLKVIVYVILLSQHIVNYNHQVILSDGRIKLYVEAFDTKSYIFPVENLLAEGTYIENFQEPLSKIIRMPGYKLRLLKMFLIHSGVGALSFKSYAELKTNRNIIEIALKTAWAITY